MRLIDADAFIEEARNRIDMQDEYLPIHIKYFVIDEMPTIDAEPVRHGRWEDKKVAFYLKCSECGATVRKNLYEVFLDCDIRDLNYCPHCGARMEVNDEL